jgi:hypothetical protein
MNEFIFIQKKHMLVRGIELRGIRASIGRVLIGTLCLTSLPQSARAQNSEPARARPQVTVHPDVYQQKSLPGICSGACIGGTIAAGAAAAGLIVYLVYAKHKQKKAITARFDAKPVKFSDYSPGQAAKLTVPLTNNSNAAITVKEIALDDKSGALSLNGSQQSFTLAPGESYPIPVTLSTQHSSGKARIRITVDAEKMTKKGVVKGHEDIVKYIPVSWGGEKAKHHKSIP